MRNAILLIIVTFSAATTALAQADIHKVDFNNFTYEPWCASEQTTRIRVKNGKYLKETQQDGFVDRMYFDVLDVTYGDVTGDGKDEAVILTNCNTGGTGQFSEGFVYTIRNGKPSLVARVPGGDRADGGLRSINVENGLLVVEYNDPEKAAGACCPEGVVIQKMRVTGGKVVDTGTPIKHELYPKERISFAKGTSGKTFTVTIPKRDRKRYVLNARAGQTMSVSYTGGNKDTSVGLLDTDAADVTDATRKFDARLKRGGDHVVEISNYGSRPVTLTLTIRIR